LKFECQRCGWCCTHLNIPLKTPLGRYGWVNTAYSSSERFSIIFTFERDILRKEAARVGKYLKFPICEFWVDKSQKLVIVMTYMFPKKICDFYDNEYKKCIIYEKRPTVCRIFPISDIQITPNFTIRIDNLHCPEAQRIFGKGKETSIVRAPTGYTFADILGYYYFDAVMSAFYCEYANQYIIKLKQENVLELAPFKPKQTKKILTRYNIIDFEKFFFKIEGKKFRPIVKNEFRKKLEIDNKDLYSKGLSDKIVDVDEVMKWINKYW